MKPSSSSTGLGSAPVRFVETSVLRPAAASFATASHASIQSAYTSTGAERSVHNQHVCHPRDTSAPHTVDIGLESLPTDLALQVADTGLLLDGHRHGLFVVAEQALECRWQLLLLEWLLASVGHVRGILVYLLGTLRLA